MNDETKKRFDRYAAALRNYAAAQEADRVRGERHMRELMEARQVVSETGEELRAAQAALDEAIVGGKS